MRRLTEPTIPVAFDEFPELEPERKYNFYPVQRCFPCFHCMVDAHSMKRHLLERPSVQLRLNQPKHHRPGEVMGKALVLPRRVRWTTDFAYYRDSNEKMVPVYGHFQLHGKLIWVCVKPHAAKPADIRRGLSPKTRWAVLERSGRACSVCGATAADGAKLEVDHIRPVALGGTNELSNLQVLCKTCNIGKGAQYDGELL